MKPENIVVLNVENDLTNDVINKIIDRYNNNLEGVVIYGMENYIKENKHNLFNIITVWTIDSPDRWDVDVTVEIPKYHGDCWYFEEIPNFRYTSTSRNFGIEVMYEYVLNTHIHNDDKKILIISGVKFDPITYNLKYYNILNYKYFIYDLPSLIEHTLN